MPSPHDDSLVRKRSRLIAECLKAIKTKTVLDPHSETFLLALNTLAQAVDPVSRERGQALLTLKASQVAYLDRIHAVCCP